MKNKKNAYVYFTYVNFSRSNNHKIQLLNTYDLEPCKIMYYYGNNRIYCSEWFANGGNMIYDDRKPSEEFLKKYQQKGFQFENNFFNASYTKKTNINDLFQKIYFSA